MRGLKNRQIPFSVSAAECAIIISWSAILKSLLATSQYFDKKLSFY